MCGNAANKKQKNKLRGSSNGSPATVPAAELTAIPPLPTHDRKQRHSKQHLGEQLVVSISISTTLHLSNFRSLMLLLLPQYDGGFDKVLEL